MTIFHHLDEATVLRYASGDLDEAFAVVVATHLAMCETCRKAVRLAEEIGGHLLEEGDVVPVSDTEIDRVMKAVDASGEPVTPAPAAANSAPGDVPLPLRRYIGADLSSVRWKTVAPGVRRHRIALETKCQSALYMLHIAPGKAVPEHGHGGAEITLILSGAYRDDLGRFGPGDVADLDEHVEHQPVVEGDQPCICLVTTEAPTRFKGIVSRLLQPLIGI